MANKTKYPMNGPKIHQTPDQFDLNECRLNTIIVYGPSGPL